MSKLVISFIKKNPISFLVIYGIIIRSLVLFFYQIPTLFPDSDGYIELASKISTFSLDGYGGTRSPGYPLLIFLTGNWLKLTIIFQFFLGIITSILCFKIAYELLQNKKTAFITTFLFSSLIHIVFFETSILTEAFTYFLISYLFYLLIKNKLENSSSKQDLGLSFLLGFLVLVKPFYIFFPFLIFVAYSFNNFNLKKIISRKLVIFIFPLLTFLGWSYVNKLNTGYFTSTTLYGFNMAQNCVSFAENTTEEYKEIGTIYAKYRDYNIQQNKSVEMSIWDAHLELEKHTKLSLPDLSSKLSNYSNATIKLNPTEYLKQVFVSWWNFWKTNLYIDEQNFYLKKSNSFFDCLWNVEHFPLRLFKIFFLITIPMQLISFFKSKKIDTVFLITLLIFAASILQALVTYGTNSRFSYPFEFVMAIIVLVQAKKYFTKIRN
ncbi:hypothetical protein [Flavobacterium capsici]|uniref:Glycosyltransferase family 39 protein n=1 Tax=Flavobacterium capsici TaxID=3075618 RepID=A0AA96EXL1_9FLAO|nr:MULTISPECIES: hypothetical protein [unclassified Flavobacterium]WNM18745.1 hypothetical protein RN608_12095 [Flavobacterium sp. PMR2A8]WNM22796.1 hypothetical protein RN605_05395 [Flavobacterium sp. PMTSA4]